MLVRKPRTACVRARARALKHTDAVYVPDTDAVYVALHIFSPLSPHLVCATGLTLYRLVSLSLSLPHSLDNIEHTRRGWWSGLF